ncbi:MAG: GLPGLI family protein [Bacteroidaceae bacterium]|nr:GLPGLI family protein [Prevotella sp.]MBQ7986935.1 GLPGLI family protein [Bacteroidaceae bacterium]
MRRIMFIALVLAVCSGAWAQPKANGKAPIREKRGYDQRRVVDTASVRVLYALNAKDIKDENTYLDLGKLEVGKRMCKYSSEFIYLSDLEVTKWKREKGHRGYVPKTFFIRGDKPKEWSELVYSDYFVQGDKLTEWASMPLYAEKDNGRYTEPWPLMRWELKDSTKTILHHKCQMATCHFRGRDFIAWFAPDVPIKGGPWKLGGLPGCILKVYDTQFYYKWEAVAIERGTFPICQYPETLYPTASRKRIWKLQKEYTENYWNAVGVVWESGPVKRIKYEQLEKE